MKRDQVHGKVINQIRLGLEMLIKHLTYFICHLIEIALFWNGISHHMARCKTMEHEEFAADIYPL